MSEYGIMRVPRRRPPARGHGSRWVVFAGVMLLVASVLNAIYGFSAIYNDDYVAEEDFLYGPVSLWGWLAVGIAVVMLITALVYSHATPWRCTSGSSSRRSTRSCT
jgi:hypothetical protein